MDDFDQEENEMMDEDFDSVEDYGDDEIEE